MPVVIGPENCVRCSVDHHGFHCGGTYVHSDKEILVHNVISYGLYSRFESRDREGAGSLTVVNLVRFACCGHTVRDVVHEIRGAADYALLVGHLV